jgi:hypothetical protein
MLIRDIRVQKLTVFLGRRLELRESHSAIVPPMIRRQSADKR